MTVWRRCLSLATLLLCLLPATARAVELHVAVAANFSAPLRSLAPLFEQATGHRLIPSPGSSGTLYSKIKAGAPYDVFLSADGERPERLEQEGLLLPGSRGAYALGTLVLWSREPGRVDGAGKVLTSGEYRHLAIANPRTAPYGRAAQQLLEALGLWHTLQQQNRLVMGESIGQAWQFAASGNAELGLVALSDVKASPQGAQGSWWLPPEALYSPIEQQGAVLARTREPEAARQFMQWLRTDPAALRVLREAGYRLPEAH